MPTFSPALITVMRSVLEDAMTQVSAEQATTVTKAYLAEFILKAAAEGLTNYEDLITAAMSGPDRGSPRPTVSSDSLDVDSRPRSASLRRRWKSLRGVLPFAQSSRTISTTTATRLPGARVPAGASNPAQNPRVR
jgi:hypothetical protein